MEAVRKYEDNEMDVWEAALTLLDSAGKLPRPETNADVIDIEKVKAMRAIGYAILALSDVPAAQDEVTPKPLKVDVPQYDYVRKTDNHWWQR